MFKVTLALAFAMATIAPAHAVTTIILSPNNAAIPGFTTATSIQSFTTARPDNSVFVPNTTNTSGTESVVAGQVPAFTTEVLLAGMTGDYLRIGNGSSYTLTLTNPAAVFSFAFNNIVVNSILTLNYVGGTSQAFNGQAMLGSPAVAPAFGRVTYDVGTGPKILSVIFAKNGNNAQFVIDEIAVAAPEPATWLMMILGFGLVGSQLRRRRGRAALAAA